ncbi:MAG: type II toxin-antitoxin system VapC family toxin [Chloroflexi bacterium]|nr:type II toxin-antitoxin system VapC family toxin [Chloroflexota bacterium]
MARYLLDTGLVIRHLRGERRIVRLLRGIGKRERLTISSITRIEVLAGMHPEERYQTRKLLSRFLNYDVTKEIADRTGDLLSEYRQRGQAIALPDTIIAATALQQQLTLITLNPKDYPFQGLSLYPLPE